MTKLCPYKLYGVALTLLSLFLSYSVYDLKKQVETTPQIHAKKMTIQPKIALLDFNYTVEQWSKIDPSGVMARKALDNTITTYNRNGYVIFDTKMVIGDNVWIPVIKALPEQLTGADKHEN